MMRWLFSIVFCISMVAASNAHASMLAKKQVHVVAAEQPLTLAGCVKESSPFIASAKTRCMQMATSKTGNKRCQIEAAPPVSEITVSGFAVHCTNLPMIYPFETGLERAPPLDPPRAVHVL